MKDEKPAPRILGEGHEKVGGRRVWAVESRSEAGAYYRVTQGEYALECTCPGYNYRRTCAHCTAVQKRLDKEADDALPAHERALPPQATNLTFSIWKS